MSKLWSLNLTQNYKKNMNIKIINYDECDWKVLIKDGKILYQNQSIPYLILLETLESEYETINFESGKEQWDEFLAQHIKDNKHETKDQK